MNRPLNPLFNPDAELSVIGALLQDPDTHRYIPELTLEDFNDPALRVLFWAIQTLHARRETIDLVTVDAQVQRDLGEAFNNSYVEKATDASLFTPTTANTQAYVRLVKQCGARRRLSVVAQRLQEMIADSAVSVEDAVDRTRRALREAYDAGALWEGVGDVLRATYAHIDETLTGAFQPVQTDIKPLDCLFGGFVPGEVTVVGARPGVGKSAFAGQVGINAALAGKRVGIVSLEMSRIQYGQRLLANRSGIDSQKIRRADLTDPNLEEIVRAYGDLSALPIEFMFRCRTVEHLASAVHQRKDDLGLDLLILDYLQLLRTEKKFRNEYERVTFISQSVKELSIMADLPILALAQLSRASTLRQDKRPLLSDLKDSGSIEQDADNVILLHRPEDAEDTGVHQADRPYFESYRQQGYHYLHLAVVKQRQGELGAGNLLFDPRTMRYVQIRRD